jgi:hypothetical protein
MSKDVEVGVEGTELDIVVRVRCTQYVERQWQLMIKNGKPGRVASRDYIIPTPLLMRINNTPMNQRPRAMARVSVLT